jgi:predicted transcriptional regulator
MDENNFHLEDFKPFISKLPQREIDLIDMYYKKNKKQKEIANFFGVTQGAISHRLSRARKRLAFLRDMPKLTQDIRGALEEHFNGFEIDVIIYMIETTCQSRTATILNEQHKLEGRDVMTQVKVRHKFDRAIAKLSKLKKTFPELKDVLDLVKYIKSNLYMLHEVILPHFDKGFKVRIKDIH